MSQYDTIWVAVMLGLVLFFGAVAVDARAFRSRQKEYQLMVAVRSLRQHYAAMRILDDQQTPSELLDIALKMSRIIHDPKAPLAIEAALLVGDHRFEPSGVDDAERKMLSEAFRQTITKRPDLAAAFVSAMASAMAAFIARWPKCEPAFGPVLVALAAHPAEEAQRLVRAADAAREKASAKNRRVPPGTIGQPA
jgi:hypothetical protein